ncbi:MAG: VOC family protein [Dehalococcoidia bacterium]|nr:VOC family protein [Dehalococcoidia bacterium]MDW8119976.1 VOC family protein [Chloroflexota bacterium]
MFKWIDHIVVAVNNLEQAVQDYEKRLGLKPTGEVGKAHPHLGLRNAYFYLGTSGRFIELAEPLGPDTPLGRTLQRRGEGIHLVALAVEDLAQARDALKSRGVQLIEAGGLVFIHPKDTHGILFQLVERKGEK